MTDERLNRRRTADVTHRRIDDKTVVLDGSGAAYFVLNETGTVLWDPLERGATRAELQNCLTEQFDITTEQARADVDTFLDDLREHGLLEEHA